MPLIYSFLSCQELIPESPVMPGAKYGAFPI